MKLTRQNLTMAFVAALAVLAAFALLGHPIVPIEALAGLGFMPLAAGEISIKEVLEAQEKQGRAWEEFKKTNDERLAKLAKGESVAELEAKLAKMNDDIALAAKELKELTLKANRPVVSAEKADRAELDLKAFNAKAQASAMELGVPFQAMSADGYAAYKQALNVLIRKGKEAMTPDQLRAINVGTSSQGGYLVGEEMEATIDRVVRNYSAMRQLARVITIGQASYKKLVKTSGTSGGTRGNERTTATEGTSPNWSELKFDTGTFLSDQRVTSEALEDAVIDVEGDLMEEIGIEFAEMEGDNFVDGDGLNGPRGFLDYTIVANASYAWQKVGYVASGAAADFATSNPSDKLIDLVHALRRQYRAGAAWIMNDATLAAIRKFKDGQGNYLWGMTAPSNLMAGAVGTLLGYPVATDDFMPDVGANAYPVAFADWKRAYYVIDRKGIAILRDPYTAHPYVKFVARKRVGGGIANFEAVKLLKIASS